MPTFSELVASRKAWIADVLRPWCRSAPRQELLRADEEWIDLAGKVDAESTLWRWAWSRFPDLIHEQLGIDETTEVEVELNDGRRLRGFPDSRQSRRGLLVLLISDESGRFVDAGPFSLDEIIGIRRTPGELSSEL